MELNNTPFWWHGPRPAACLMLHGLGGGVYEMAPLGQVLYQQGWTVCGLNYPGHDRPAGRMPASRWEEWYGAVVAAYTELRQTYERVHIIGFSTGTLLGLHLAAHHPVASLTLLAPFFGIHQPWFSPWPTEVYVNTLGRLIADLPRLRLPIHDPEMAALAKQVAFFHSFNLAAVRSACELMALVKTELPRITAAALILQSRRDQVVRPAGAQFLHDTLGSTEKKLIWLHRSNHILTLDYEREQVTEAVVGFLNGRP
ncbi:MAG: alpha/beta fold hydrolase [Gloeomargaritaceae cyanobacterium C42_A2020_066]|nr:alpha/beta fold hydrolase [Gloeomargaritaceae cyanobacterium C42_A2020_066]